MRNYVSTYFSPNRGAIDVIVGFINRCNKTIIAAVYSVTHKSIIDALINAHNRGVKVRLLTDALQAEGQHSGDEALLAAGVELRVGKKTGLMHHKFMVGDSTAAATGSFNWTVRADERNAENFVVIRLKYVINDFEEEFEKQWDLAA